MVSSFSNTCLTNVDSKTMEEFKIVVKMETHENKTIVRLSVYQKTWAGIGCGSPRVFAIGVGTSIHK